MKKINKYLISLILVLVLLTGCNNNDINNTVNPDNEVESSNGYVAEDGNTVLEKNGHTLDSSIGYFIVDKDGSVYYQPSESGKYMGMTYALTKENLSVLGAKQQHKNYTYQSDPLCDIDEGCTIEAYKLDLTNISSAYEVSFGNGGIAGAIIFLSYDGEVHELSFLLDTSESTIELTKNVSKYPNIVSVVKNAQFGGHGAMLIDKNGNKYDYTEATK